MVRVVRGVKESVLKGSGRLSRSDGGGRKGQRDTLSIGAQDMHLMRELD